MTNQIIPCCNLGKEYETGKNILYESDNFFISPTVGSISIEGYILLCSKKHFHGTGDIPKNLYPELEEIVNLTRKKLFEKYKKDVLIFEHGPKVCNSSGGSCLDHAHLHCMPVSMNVMEKLVINLLNGLNISNKYSIEKMQSFDCLKQVYDKQKESYFFIETNNKERFMSTVNFSLPSQYIRKIVAKGLDRFWQWNWKEYPDIKTFNKTFEELYGWF